MQLPPSKAEPAGRVLDHDESLQKINTQKLRGLKPYFKQVMCFSSAMKHRNNAFVAREQVWMLAGGNAAQAALKGLQVCAAPPVCLLLLLTRFTLRSAALLVTLHCRRVVL